MPHGVPTEPPPLLSTAEYNRVPLEALSVNHGAEEAAKLHKTKLKMKHTELLHIEQNVRHRELEWAGMLQRVAQGVQMMTHRNESDATTFRSQMDEVSRKIYCIEQSIDVHLLIRDLPAVATHITAAMNTTKADIIVDNCAAARQLLDKHQHGLPDVIDVPNNIKQLLVSCERNETAANGANPVPALIAQCERLCGQAYMEQDQYEQAAQAFLTAVELVNKEEGPSHWVAKELATHYHAARQKANTTVQQQPPSTPDASARRKHYEASGSQTPPPRKATEMEVAFTRSGAATPSTGRGKSNWDSPAGGSYQFSFGRWGHGAPTPADTTTPSPAPPRAERKCHHCGVPATRERKLMLCSKCKKVCFCSQECHTAAWDAGHSDVCEDYNETTTAAWYDS